MNIYIIHGRTKSHNAAAAICCAFNTVLVSTVTRQNHRSYGPALHSCSCHMLAACTRWGPPSVQNGNGIFTVYCPALATGQVLLTQLCLCCLQHLGKLGVASPFDPLKADISRIAGHDHDSLYISNVLQSVRKPSSENAVNLATSMCPAICMHASGLDGHMV
jgi:hypothetical protein